MSYYPTSKENLIIASLLLLKQIFSEKGATRFHVNVLKNYMEACCLMANKNVARRRILQGKRILESKLTAKNIYFTQSQQEFIEDVVDTACSVWDSVNDRRFAKCLALAEHRYQNGVYA